ncbi:uncharacterized protein BX664DRAFT_338362 [Halteromyces radiatus]|uniref:uncharacterized protein n=1 Tax=Halteromyces radiatus TaxID=101107 RepID=UPI00221F605F|nr:uncharacterized protein BX664DRAFT_338362 [Halteromyces radiatus]KAI8085027.1 hypothetical protein BX664DRAFT_338362 [Halteromyces radiatus]
MYPQRQQYQPMDTGVMYHQPQHRPYPTPQPPPPPPPEPLPSATDVHTTALSISQMAEFSSTMVYLMWHERSPSVLPLHSSVLHSRPDPSSPATTGASNAFRKYCRSILQATQLSESVVLLSLKYIALLLRNNPQLRGAEGSEYRLYTVALMLANKFLDDNTFTNKTWSDISGMKVNELNVMEFEFLDVLRFALFIPKVDFDHWKTTLFNFRSKLYDPSMGDVSHRGPQHQQLIEATLKNMGLPMQYNQQHDQWQQQQYQKQEAARQQQQQQQQQQAAAAAAQQQYNQHLYLLSKAQQPHIPPQPLNGPLTRVPLRIPVRPIYQTQGMQSTSTPGTHTATVYDPSIGVSSSGTSATVIQPASAAPQIASQPYTPASMTNMGSSSGRRTPIVPSTENAFTSTSYSSQQPPARIITNTSQRPYDYTRSSAEESQGNIYSGQKQPLQTSAHVIAPGVPSHSKFYGNDIYSQQQQQQQQSINQQQISAAGHRTTSLPSAGLEATIIQPSQPHMNSMGNGLTSVTTAPSLQPPSSVPPASATSSSYYNTPSSTPSSTLPHNSSPHRILGPNDPHTAFINAPNATSYSANPSQQINYGHHPPPVRVNNPVANNPSRPPYFVDPSQQQHRHHQQQQHQQQHSSNMANPSGGTDYNYGAIPSSANDIYGRPTMGRTSSNPVYQVKVKIGSVNDR